MAAGPDPFGKRALFWMPLDPLADGAGEASERQSGRSGGPSAPTRPSAERPARPAGKRALFSSATAAGERERSTSSATAGRPLPPRGLLTVACSVCGSVTKVGVARFLFLQIPFGVWLPRREFDRWMTCPACRRRAWTSVTISR